jgi:hypothetical protein
MDKKHIASVWYFLGAFLLLEKEVVEREELQILLAGATLS